MTLASQPWVQSLLIVGRHKIQDSDVHEGVRQFLAERGTHEVETTSDSPFRIRTISSAMTISDSYRIADLCRYEPFWDALRLPAFARSFESLGNTVAVGRFPTPVPFILQMIVCGHGTVSVQVEIDGPSRPDDMQDAVPECGPLLTSPARSVDLRPLKRRVSGELGVATILEHVAPVFDEEGIYFVVARLDGNAAGKLALKVRLEQ